MRTLVLVNRSTSPLVTPAWLASFAIALGKQIADDFAPAWDLAPWSVEVLSADDTRPEGAADLVIFDTSDDPRLAGYHDKTPDGRAYGRGFVGGGSLANLELTLSHEGLELLGNTEADLVVHGTDDVHRCREACDPCEDVSYPAEGSPGITHTMSDFVFPTWFEPETPAGTPVDFRGALTKPGTKTSGGYFLEEDEHGNIVSTPLGAHRIGARAHPSSRPSKIARAAMNRRGPEAHGYRSTKPDGSTVRVCGLLVREGGRNVRRLTSRGAS